jgi:hypothetical protein
MTHRPYYLTNDDRAVYYVRVRRDDVLVEFEGGTGVFFYNVRHWSAVGQWNASPCYWAIEFEVRQRLDIPMGCVLLPQVAAEHASVPADTGE